MDIGALCQCLQPHVPAPTRRQLSRMALAMLVMTGRVTMLGLARWGGTGGRYRTVQRFFATVIPWATLFWVFFRQHAYRAEDVYLLAGDEVVATQAGTHPDGLDRCFASLYGKPLPGLAFFTLSLISTQARRAFPVCVEQVIRSDTEQAASKAQAAAQKAHSSMPKRRPGRPKGRKNTNKAAVTLTLALVRSTSMMEALRHRIAACLPLTSLVLDGHFGHHHAWHIAPQCRVHLIATLRADSAVSWPYDGPYAGTGPRRTDGSTLASRSMPEPQRKATTVEGHIETRLSQAPWLHKEFAQPLHVVIIVKTNLHTQAQAHVLLCSSDLTLADASLVDYVVANK